MKRYLKFLAIGSLFATVEEFLTVVVLKRNVIAYLLTLVVVFPVYLTLIWFSSRFLARLLTREAVQELAHYLLAGCVGLAFEWFVIGLSPWSNPDANPALMLAFQLGMFSFWATVGFAPRLSISTGELHRRTWRRVLRFYVPYFLATYVVAFLAPPALRFVAVIGLIVLGYGFLNVFYALHFARSFWPKQAVDHFGEAPGEAASPITSRGKAGTLGPRNSVP